MKTVKGIRLLLSVFMLGLVISFGHMQADASGFSDVGAGQYYSSAVDWAFQEGVTAGVGGGLFGTGQTLTRGQASTFVYNLMKATDKDTSKQFSDVEPGYWFANPISWMARNGYAAGYPDGTFRPEQVMTRAEALTFLRNVMNGEGGYVNFTDVQAGSWMYRPVSWAYHYGVLIGVPNITYGGDLHPDWGCTREEFVTYMWNAKGRPGDKSSEGSHSTEYITLVNGRAVITKAEDGFVRINYAIEYMNTYRNKALSLININVIARSADGRVLSVGEDYLSEIAAGDRTFYSGSHFYEGEKPDDVEILLAFNGYLNDQDNEKYPYANQFTVKQSQVNRTSYNTTITGEISNNSHADLSLAHISVVYKKNGNIVGGDYGYITGFNKGTTRAFEVYCDVDPELYDSYEVYVGP